MSRPGWDDGDVGAKFYGWLHEHFDKYDPAGVIYESPIMNLKKANYVTLNRLYGMCFIFRTVARQRRIKWIKFATPGTIKKHFTGNGAATKEQMIARCRQLGWTVENDDHADGLAAWSYAAVLAENEP